MPQRTSYFALKLPQGWWILGFDLALDDDINIEQFHFFANLAENSMKPGDAAIIVSHGKSLVLMVSQCFAVHLSKRVLLFVLKYLTGCSMNMRIMQMI